jgi:hypothetical protein
MTYWLLNDLNPQEPRQRNAQIDEAPRWLQVKDKNLWPCENTHLTAVEVAIGGIVKQMQNPISILLTRDAKIVQSHAIKVQVNMMVSNPPSERIPTGLHSSSEIQHIGHWDIWEGRKFIIVNLWDYYIFIKHDYYHTGSGVGHHCGSCTLCTPDFLHYSSS